VDGCKHEVDEETVEYDKNYGRKGKCKLCGCKLAITKEIHLNPNRPARERLSKKKRLSRKRNIAKAVAIAKGADSGE
jgi:hypothetical protein